MLDVRPPSTSASRTSAAGVRRRAAFTFFAAMTLSACAGLDEPGPDPEPDPGPDGGAACASGDLTSGVSTLAGCDQAGMIDGDRADARFHNPVNVARGPDGRLYVADFDNGRIRVVDDDGHVATVVERSGFERPFGLAFAAEGTLYVSTDANPAGERSPTTGTIWAVDVERGDATVIVRDVGRPRGLLALPDGRLVVSDHHHHTLRILTPSTKAFVALAGLYDVPGDADGTGSTARFREPVGLARLADGRVAVADMENHTIRAVALDGTVTTLARDGFSRPQGLAADAAGNLYITDTDHYVVKRLVDGVVTTVVGSGRPGSVDSDDLLDAEIFGLEGLAVAADGARLWIADGSRGEDLPHHRVRVAELTPP